MIKFKLEEGVSLPEYETPTASGFDVIAHSILKAYKGDAEITGDKLDKMKQGFNDRGYIKLRPFERILFGTGVTFNGHAGSSPVEFRVSSNTDVALKRGLFIVPGRTKENKLEFIVYNSTPFLNKIEKDEKIAKVNINFTPLQYELGE